MFSIEYQEKLQEVVAASSKERFVTTKNCVFRNQVEIRFHSVIIDSIENSTTGHFKFYASCDFLHCAYFG